MIDKGIVESGLEALSVAVGAILEDNQLLAVSRLPPSQSERRRLFERLEATGHDIAGLAQAAAILLRRSE